MYKSGYTLMIFRDLEREVVRFLDNIPLEYYQNPKDREKIFSPKLANILINIGSRVDEFFRNWDIIQALTKDINYRYLDLRDYRLIELLNILTLNDKKLSKPNIGDIYPFENWIHWGEGKFGNPNNRQKTPRIYNDWWSAYNHVKHNGYNSRKEGNLNNVILSLGGLFVLNCVHIDVWQNLSTEPDSVDNSHIWNNNVRTESELFGFRSNIVYESWNGSVLWCEKCQNLIDVTANIYKNDIINVKMNCCHDRKIGQLKKSIHEKDVTII